MEKNDKEQNKGEFTEVIKLIIIGSFFNKNIYKRC